MKKLFSASLFTDVVPLFSGFAQENLAGKRVAFIPTASLVEEVNFYVGITQKV